MRQTTTVEVEEQIHVDTCNLCGLEVEEFVINRELAFCNSCLKGELGVSGISIINSNGQVIATVAPEEKDISDLLMATLLTGFVIQVSSFVMGEITTVSVITLYMILMYVYYLFWL